MSATFDCGCHWQLAETDLSELHADIVSAGAFLDERRDVLMSGFSRDGELESLTATLEAADKGAARKALEQIAGRIEKRIWRSHARDMFTRELLEVEDELDASAAFFDAGCEYE